MLLRVVHYPEKSLAQKCAPITEVTDELRQLAKDMAETMYREDGIGLAAPQVGKNIRFITVDVSGPEKRESLMCLVNPELEMLEEHGYVESEEGCLSVPELRSKVVRYERVRLKATDLDGNAVEFEADGLLAICLQHEVDHLDGTLFIDKISRLKRSLYDSKVKKWMKASKRK